MEKQVLAFMKEEHMVLPQGKLVAAVSGGADSTALLLVLKALQPQLGYQLEAFHVEHGIRGEESLRDADFTMRLCEQLGVPCRLVHVDVPAYAGAHGLGLEEAARILRYAKLREYAMKTGAGIALAHHMEDNAETILFQQARGSGLAGLCGMQPLTEREGVTWLRPLLGIRRREIESYLHEHAQGFCTDSSNADLQYSRNRIRSRVLPELEQVNDQAIRHIHEGARQLSLIHRFMEKESAKAYDSLSGLTGDGAITLNIRGLKDLDAALQGPVLLRALEQAAGRRKDITAAHVNSLLQLADRQTGSRVSLPYGLLAERRREELRIGRQGIGDYAAQSTQLPGSCGETIADLPIVSDRLQWGQTMEIFLPEGRISLKCFAFSGNTGEIPENPYTKWFDYDKIVNDPVIRTRKPGDYLVIDRLGHRKKLQNYLTDIHLSAGEKDRLPLLADGSCILWCIGKRASLLGLVTEETKTIIEMKYTEVQHGLQQTL